MSTADNDIKGIITEVFNLTGQKISEDDPIVAVLLMQRHWIDQYFAERAAESLENANEFLMVFEQKVQQLNSDVQALTSIRKDTVIQLQIAARDIAKKAVHEEVHQKMTAFDDVIRKRFFMVGAIGILSVVLLIVVLLTQ